MLYSSFIVPCYYLKSTKLAIVQTTPITSLNLHPHTLNQSPNTQTPNKAPNTAWVANSTPVRRGPRRFMAANRAVSPIKMPTKPLKDIIAQDDSGTDCQVPDSKVMPQRISATRNMRQRVNANAPRCRAGETDKILLLAQQAAAPSASQS